MPGGCCAPVASCWWLVPSGRLRHRTASVFLRDLREAHDRTTARWTSSPWMLARAFINSQAPQGSSHPSRTFTRSSFSTTHRLALLHIPYHSQKHYQSQTVTFYLNKYNIYTFSYLTRTHSLQSPPVLKLADELER